MIKILKAPLPRLGGKSRLRKDIISMIPEHTCYVEAFFGMGWVYFGKKPSKVEVINDIEGEVINLFRMIKYHSEEIQRLMQYEICSRDLFNIYKEQNPENLTEIQRAIRYMYLISQSFGAKGGVFGYGTTTRPSPQIFNTDNLKLLKERLRNTYIENLDYKKVIEKYDREYTFFFCDPPYLGKDISFSSQHKIQFGEKEHRELCSMLRNIKGKFLLTINDHNLIRDMYKDFNIIKTKVNYSIGKKKESRKKYGELIITNYTADRVIENSRNKVS